MCEPEMGRPCLWVWARNGATEDAQGRWQMTEPGAPMLVTPALCTAPSASGTRGSLHSGEGSICLFGQGQQNWGHCKEAQGLPPLPTAPSWSRSATHSQGHGIAGAPLPGAPRPCGGSDGGEEAIVEAKGLSFQGSAWPLSVQRPRETWGSYCKCLRDA